MISRETLYEAAIAFVFKYAPAIALELWRRAGSATIVWESRNDIRDAVPEASPRLVETVRKLEDILPLAEKEMEFAERNGIQCLGIGDADYPARLKGCADAPLVLFYKGSANLNSRRVISVVGTRHCTEYGRGLCESLTRDLAVLAPGTVVVSGLAYGIDINAHRGALAAGLPTVGVLAHGLDTIYPAMHRETARNMLVNGGLVTEFPSGTIPEKTNFVRRNRIIAGLSDATIVVESATKGGSLITASVAESYDREVCAFPGRVGDVASEGCNMLIMENKARMITSAEILIKALCWDCETNPAAVSPAAPELFPQLSVEEQKIADSLEGSDGKQINLITVETNIPMARLMSVLFEMEMRGIVKSLNGARYRLNR